MRMNNFNKFALGLIAVAIIASCSMSTSMDATVERDVEAATVLKEEAKVPNKPIADDVIRVKNDIWLGNKSEVEFEGEAVPAHLEKKDSITLISNRPITLYEIGDMINKTTSLKVRYAPEISEDALAAAEQNVPSAESINADWAFPNQMLVSYRGPLSGFLEEVSSRFGIWWKYEKREIYFYKNITRTFTIYSLPSKPTLSVTVGGSTEGEGGTSSINLSNSIEMELWGNIEKSIREMIDQNAKLTIDPTNGTVSLTATPTDVQKVAKYVNEQNARLSRQVAISVKVLQVAINDSDQYGLNFNTMFNDGSSSFGIQSIPAFGNDITQNLTMTVLPGNWTVSAFIQALSKQGTTTMVTSGTVTTLNNKPAPIQVIKKQNYISEITKTNSGGDGNFYDVSTETKEIETGFTMDVLPRILEHGRLLVMFNLTLSDLLSLEKVFLSANEDGSPAEGGNDQYIQNPIIESRGFTQEVALKSGESLILTGYERVENQAEKTGVGSATNSLLGGTAMASKVRSVLVIILTPVVMESPLVPESRMRND